jgi:LysM repeat protein
LSLMLRRGIEVIVGAALAVVVLFAVVPAVAQAQEEGAASARVVVSPGDTLWSISSERLGPDPTPQQIAREVERIYALNRDQIGSDPNLIFSGQELSLPAVGGSSTGKPATKKTDPAAQAAQGGRTIKGEPANQQASLPNLPKVPASATVPTIGSLATDTSPTTSSLTSAVRSAVEAPSIGTFFAEAQATADGRRLLGRGIIALTVLLAVLMAWKLPMRRDLRDSEVWDTYPGYLGRYYAYSEALEPEPTAEPGGNGSTTQAHPAQKGISPVGLGGIAQKRRQLTRRTLKRLPRRRSSAAEAHSAEAQRALRGAVLRTRARAPRNGRLKTARRIAEGGR